MSEPKPKAHWSDKHDYSYARKVYGAASMGPQLWIDAPMRTGDPVKTSDKPLVPLKVGKQLVEDLAIKEIEPTEELLQMSGPVAKPKVKEALLYMLGKEGLMVYVCCEDAADYNFFDLVLVSMNDAHIIQDLFVFYDRPVTVRGTNFGKKPSNEGFWHFYSNIGDHGKKIVFRDDYDRMMAYTRRKDAKTTTTFSELDRFVDLFDDTV
jgi:hypothetical protein